MCGAYSAQANRKKSEKNDSKNEIFVELKNKNRSIGSIKGSKSRVKSCT